MISTLVAVACSGSHPPPLESAGCPTAQPHHLKPVICSCARGSGQSCPLCHLLGALTTQRSRSSAPPCKQQQQYRPPVPASACSAAAAAAAAAVGLLHPSHWGKQGGPSSMHASIGLWRTGLEPRSRPARPGSHSEASTHHACATRPPWVHGPGRSKEE